MSSAPSYQAFGEYPPRFEVTDPAGVMELDASEAGTGTDRVGCGNGESVTCPVAQTSYGIGLATPDAVSPPGLEVTV